VAPWCSGQSDGLAEHQLPGLVLTHRAVEYGKLLTRSASVSMLYPILWYLRSFSILVANNHVCVSSEVNRHTMRLVVPVSMVQQLLLVPG